MSDTSTHEPPSTGPKALDVLRSVVDPVRLAVLGASIDTPAPLDELSEHLGVRRKDIAAAIGYLRGVGLLDEHAIVDQSALMAIARSIPSGDTQPVHASAGLWTEGEVDILDRFFDGNRLVSVPSSHSKRRLVLERIVQEFEPGVRYDERDVNFTIQLIYADYAAIRRYLVDEAMLDRADGSYWRIGGRYSVDQQTTESTPARRTLSTERSNVDLRPYAMSMLDDLVALADDERVAPFLADGFPFPYQRRDGMEFIEMATTHGSGVQYAVFVDGEYGGGVGAERGKSEATGTFTIGWWLGPRYWGLGIATVAVRALVDDLFENCGAMRVEAWVMHPNTASQRVARKSGLHDEGTAVGAILKRGVRYDQINFGVTRQQWQEAAEHR